jgi:hypothetical protein
MNLPIARSLRGLLYVLEDLSQVDPSDLSALFAGPGRLRLAFAEIDPPAGEDPSDEQVDGAARACWENPYDAFGRTVGTSLICIQGHWSNVVDARIKGRFRSVVADGAADAAYNPLYARATQIPKPWGVTALFAEHTGNHPPIEIAWPLDYHEPPAAIVRSDLSEPAPAAAMTPAAEPTALESPDDAPAKHPAAPVFASFWNFARALNRGDAAALALAGDASEPAIPIGGAELRKLLTTVWFRSVFERLSPSWRAHLFEAVTALVPLTNHVLRIGRQTVPLGDLSLVQLNDLATRTDLPDAIRSDVQVLTAIGRFWGEEALPRCQFIGEVAAEASKFDMALRMRSLLQR